MLIVFDMFLIFIIILNILSVAILDQAGTAISDSETIEHLTRTNMEQQPSSIEIDRAAETGSGEPDAKKSKNLLEYFGQNSAGTYEELAEHDTGDVGALDTKLFEKVVEAVLDVDQILKAVDTETAMDLVERSTGEKLTAETCGEIGRKLLNMTNNAVENREKETLKGVLSKKEQAVLANLQDAISTGVFPTRGTLGNKFRAEVDQSKVKNLSNKDAQTFRMQWAKDLQSSIVEKKTHAKKWTRVDSTKWTYRPFGKLVVDFGGWDDPDAVRGACTGALQCMTMGDPFVKIHPQTKMTLFAVAEIGWDEVFEQSWNQTMTYFAKPNEATVGELVDANEVDAKPGPIAKSKNAPKEPITKTLKGPTTSPRDSKEAEEKKKHAQLMKDATRVKQKMTGATSRANEILQEITKDGKYMWARNNDRGDRGLKQSLDDVRNSLNDWQRDFLVTSDFSMIKKKYSGDQIRVELSSFLLIESVVDKLISTCDSFVEASDVLSLFQK